MSFRGRVFTFILWGHFRAWTFSLFPAVMKLSQSLSVYSGTCSSSWVQTEWTFDLWNRHKLGLNKLNLGRECGRCLVWCSWCDYRTLVSDGSVHWRLFTLDLCLFVLFIKKSRFAFGLNTIQSTLQHHLHSFLPDDKRVCPEVAEQLPVLY